MLHHSLRLDDLLKLGQFLAGNMASRWYTLADGRTMLERCLGLFSFSCALCVVLRIGAG